MGGETEWTLATQRELLENKIVQVSAKHDADFALVNAKLDANSKALELKTKGDDIHFDALNHENARVADATNKSVPAGVYAADQKALDEWKLRIEGTLREQSGQRRGIGLSANTIISAISAVGVMVAMIGVIYTMVNGPHALPVANPITYVLGQPLIAPPVQK